MGCGALTDEKVRLVAINSVALAAGALLLTAATSLYPFGHAPTQLTDQVANSYMNPDDLAKFAKVGSDAAVSMNLVGQKGTDPMSPAANYSAGNIVDKYRRAPGSALDYAYASSVGGPRTVYSFALEIGRAGMTEVFSHTSRDEISGRFMPQAFNGLLTILEACSNRVFQTDVRLQEVVNRPRLAGLYDSIVKDMVTNKPRLFGP